jgi:hypothetical protein
MHPKLFALLTVALALFLPSKAFALFGIGDIVFDPTNYAKNLLTSQYTQMTNTVTRDINTATAAQLTQLQNVRNLLSNPTDTNNPIAGMALAELTNKMRTIPGMERFDAAALIRGQSPLDMFMGQGYETWRNVISNPSRGIAIEITKSLPGGLDGDPEVRFAEMIAGLSGAGRTNSRGQIMEGFTKIMTSRVLRDVETQGAKSQAFSVLNGEIRKKANESGESTVVGQLRIQNQQIATSNDLLNNLNTQMAQRNALDAVRSETEADILLRQEVWRRSLAEVK